MNLKSETLKAVDGRTIVWAKVMRDAFARGDFEAEDEYFVLAPGYTDADLAEFYEKMNFEYDNGFGMQLVEGTIVFADGTWLTRGEYDGSEWWQDHKCPVWHE